MVRKVYKILVFPGGTEIGLEIQRALCQCKDVQLYAAGTDVPNHSPYVFARHLVLPSIYDPTWIESLNRLIAEHGIDYIFPAYDDIIVALAQNKERISAGIISSPTSTCLATRSKSATYRLFANSLPVPRLYENPRDIERYPVFVKPDKGQGAQHSHIVHDEYFLHWLLENERRDYIVSEYLPGEEYTVDCFSDRDAGLLFCSGRQRVRTRSGISMNSAVVRSDVFESYARIISRKLPLHGAWFFQLKKDADGVYKLLEIAPRIAGTMALSCVQGVNLPLLSVYEQERIPIEVLTNDIQVDIDRALINRYSHRLAYSVVYVDLDDTLILDGKVNTRVVRFLYQCINQGKKVCLLTKHSGDLDRTLQTYRLAGVFDRIIHIASAGNKCDYISERDAILIDDSFAERKAASEKLGIATFDCSMVEMLYDDRS